MDLSKVFHELEIDIRYYLEVINLKINHSIKNFDLFITPTLSTELGKS
jgi:hypothetical protein